MLKIAAFPIARCLSVRSDPMSHSTEIAATGSTRSAGADPVQESVAGLPRGQVMLRPRKAQPFFGRHPWVLDSAVAKVEGRVSDGDVVDLISDKGRFIARGFFNSRSRIRVRLCTWDASELLDEAFFQGRLKTAIELRRKLGYTDPAGAARLVYSEADGLSGFIADRYGPYLAIQATSLAVAQRLDQLVPILFELIQPRGIILRQEQGAAKLEGIEHEEYRHWGQLPDGPVFIQEHGLKYGVDLREGHKTGFYLDQQENRRVVAEYANGGRVLDMFCYSGGFALNAAGHGGASEVLCVDTSEKALALARANAELNGVANMHFQGGDAFRIMQDLVDRGQRFGMVVLDPPKFARSRA